MGGNKKGGNKAAQAAHRGLAKPPPTSGLSAKQQRRDQQRAAKAAAATATSSSAPSGESSGNIGGNISGHRNAQQKQSPSISGGGISAYKRLNMHPAPYYASIDAVTRWAKFLTPSSKLYDDVMSKCYQNFTVENETTYNPSFHEQFCGALRGLETNTRFLKFDITQPGGLGSKIAKTYVSRCVVGEPGITYKYLGLRLFAYPWTAGEEGATLETVQIGQLNSDLIGHTARQLQAKQTAENPYVGSCEYNLTLINRCFPIGAIDLKKEPMFDQVCHH